MRASLQSASRSSVAQVRAVSPPIKGVNRTDNLRALDGKGYAQVIDNWLCRPKGLVVRPGTVISETAAGPVLSLLAYEDRAYPRTDGDWMGAVIPNAGGKHLVAGRQGATPLHFNGTTWGTATITGVSGAALSDFVLHGNRLFAREAGTFNVWYLGVGAIGGPAAVLPLAGLFRHGGYITAIASMSSDGGRGPDDLFVAVTTNGEMAVYRGVDPNNAASWSLVGVYEVPEPSGRRCFEMHGGTLVYAGGNAVYQVNSLIGRAKSEQPATAMSDKLTKADLFDLSSVIDSGDEFLMAHCGGVQWVRDAETGGWSRFTGLGATCWVRSTQGLHLGCADGTVRRLASTSDALTTAPVAIKTVLVDHYSSWRQPRRKVFKRIRPQFEAYHPYRPRMELLTDYREAPASWIAATTNAAHVAWSGVAWGMEWNKPTSSRIGLWRSIDGQGEAAALIMAASWSGVPAVYVGCDYAFETSAGVG